MKHIFLILIFASFVRSSFSYPYNYQTLYWLLQSCDNLIVAGIVDDYKPVVVTSEYSKILVIDEVRNDTTEHKVVNFIGKGSLDLLVKEVFVGEYNVDSKLVVNLSDWSKCSSISIDPLNKQMIAFLREEDLSKDYKMVGFSGLRVMQNEDQLNIFRKRINEYFEIEKIQGKYRREKAIVDWLFRCAENKYTRWDGAYELSKRGHFLSKYHYSKSSKFNRRLTKKQKHRLEDLFFNTDTLDYGTLCLSNFVSKKNRKKLIDYLIENIHISDFFLVKNIMKKIIELKPEDELVNLYIDVDKISYDDPEKIEKQKVLVDKFIENIKQMN